MVAAKLTPAVDVLVGCCWCEHVEQPPTHATSSMLYIQDSSQALSHDSTPNCFYYSKEPISTWLLFPPLACRYYNISSKYTNLWLRLTYLYQNTTDYVFELVAFVHEKECVACSKKIPMEQMSKLNDLKR
jgi:hypothetical protein